MYFVGFEQILKAMPHLLSEKVLRHATSFSPRMIRNFVSYFIHDTLWAYPSVTQLKKTKHKKKIFVANFFNSYLIW